LATPEQRKRLITYFIAAQTPQKLDPEDRASFYQVCHGRNNAETMLAMGATLLYAFRAPYIRSHVKTHFLATLLWRGAWALLIYYFTENAAHSIFEPRIVTSKIVGDLMEKYNFTVYDFANSKKESHLLSLAKELSNDSNRLSYIN
jgi:hypothetical protein